MPASTRKKKLRDGIKKLEDFLEYLDQVQKEEEEKSNNYAKNRDGNNS